MSPKPHSSGHYVQLGEVVFTFRKPCEITEESASVSASSVFDINLQNGIIGKIVVVIPFNNLAQMDPILPESQLLGVEALHVKWEFGTSAVSLRLLLNIVFYL